MEELILTSITGLVCTFWGVVAVAFVQMVRDKDKDTVREFLFVASLAFWLTFVAVHYLA